MGCKAMAEGEQCLERDKVVTSGELRGKDGDGE